MMLRSSSHIDFVRRVVKRYEGHNVTWASAIYRLPGLVLLSSKNGFDRASIGMVNSNRNVRLE